MSAPTEEKLLCKIIGLAARRRPIDERREYLELVRHARSPLALLTLGPGDPRCRGLREVIQSETMLRDARARVAEIEADAGITTVLFGEPGYPQRLVEIPDAPPILFVRGDLGVLHRAVPFVAMVGSRRADPSGCELTAIFARAVAAEGGCVVSGLALGIDSAAHHGALESNAAGATIAVIGSGLGNLYPIRNRSLADRIVAAGGAIVSQFDYYENPLPLNFLDRNRIISGLSGATLVVQAPSRSGALSTARHALEQGRDLLVVPGDIADRRYEGSNRLLRQGAGVVTSVADILEDVFGIRRRAGKAKNNAPAPDGLRGRILKILREHRSVAADDLLRLCGAPEDFHMTLFELELDGIVRWLPGSRLTLPVSA